jgi:hypothetical protein
MHFCPNWPNIASFSCLPVLTLALQVTWRLYPHVSCMNMFLFDLDPNQWCFPGGTLSPHLFYQGNGIPPAKIKHGGTLFPLAGIKYEWSSVDAVRHRPNNFGYHLFYIRVIFDNNCSGVKKNTCRSGSWPTLFFSADPIIFSTRLTVPYFLRVVAGCCQNGVCCHTNYWKNHEKNIQKKNYFRPTDPNFFTIWNRNHRYFFYASTSYVEILLSLF